MNGVIQDEDEKRLREEVEDLSEDQALKK